jgi:hypothetical protein
VVLFATRSEMRFSAIPHLPSASQTAVFGRQGEGDNASAAIVQQSDRLAPVGAHL